MALTNSLTIRTDPLLRAWLSRLAKDAGRTQTAMIRDLIYLMVCDDELGRALIQRLLPDQISYTG